MFIAQEFSAVKLFDVCDFPRTKIIFFKKETSLEKSKRYEVNRPSLGYDRGGDAPPLPPSTPVAVTVNVSRENPNYTIHVRCNPRGGVGTFT